MKDPCSQCLVQPACSNLCRDKFDYVKLRLKELDDLSPHLYSTNGNRRKNIPQKIKTRLEKLKKIAEKNNADIKAILYRGGTGVQI